jgi:hypothetical protein
VTGTYPNTRVLSVYPCRSGFAYAVLEGRERLVDWDVAQLGVDTEEEFRSRLQALIDKYHPQLVAFEDCSNSRRGDKTQERIEAGLGLAKVLDCRTVILSPDERRRALDLSLNATKHDIADRVATHFPELVRKAPKRTIWQRDPRMNLFDAVALGFAAIYP